MASTSSAALGLCRRFASLTLPSANKFASSRWTAAVANATTTGRSRFFSSQEDIVAPTVTQPSIVTSADGRQFAAFEIPEFHKKLKPYIVKRRLGRMRTYVGVEKNIRHSPWRMNLVCQLAAGMTLTDALEQLRFCNKRMAPLVHKVLKRTSNLASIRHGLQPSQLEVAECFATKGTPLKRLKIMGRGRSGRMEHKHTHIRVILREIDFKLRIYQAPTIGQKKRWFLRQQIAEEDAEKVAAERAEIERMERELEANRAKQANEIKS